MLNNIVTSVLRSEGKVSLSSIGIIVKADFDGEITYLFTPIGVRSDNSLLTAIAAQMDVSGSEAANLLECYIDFVKGVVAKNGKYRLNGVGDIFSNSNDVYYFTPLNSAAQIAQQEIIVEELRENVIENEVVIEEVEDNTFNSEPHIEPVPEPIEENILVSVPEEITPCEKELQAKKREVIAEEVVSRINERPQPKRLGEVIESVANRRFYDKVHTHVVAASSVDKPEIVVASDEVPIEVEKATVTSVVETAVPVVPSVPAVSAVDPVEVASTESVVVQPPVYTAPVVPKVVETEVSASTQEATPPKRKGLYDIYDKGYSAREHKVEPTINIAPVVEKITPPTFVAQDAKAAPLEAKPKKKTDIVMVLSIAVIVIGLGFIAYFYYLQQNLEL